MTPATPIRIDAPASTIGNAPFEVTVSKMGDKYFGARSNKFGYANYEIVPTPTNLEDLGRYEVVLPRAEIPPGPPFSKGGTAAPEAGAKAATPAKGTR